jgi:hypothetical protein
MTRDEKTFTDPDTVLKVVAKKLKGQGFRVELREPDANDPLGGLVIVRAPGANPVEVVNFRHELAREAIETAVSLPSVPFPVVDLVHLVALKLRAGGPQDVADAIQVLQRNHPPLERVLAAL